LTGFAGLAGVIAFAGAGLAGLVPGLPPLAGAELGPPGPAAPFGGAPPTIGEREPDAGTAGTPGPVEDLLAAPGP
jgi:hypothetical protein